MIHEHFRRVLPLPGIAASALASLHRTAHLQGKKEDELNA